LLFDTSASIEWLQGNRYLLEIAESVYISTITEYELLWSAIRKGQKTEDIVWKYLEEVIIIPISSDISRFAAKTQAILRSNGNQKSMADLLIASTAKVNNLKICRFDSDFTVISENMDVELIFLRQ